MYERCISCSIGWGGMRAPGSCWPLSGMVPLDVEVHDVLRVLLDVLPTRAHRLAHQDGEERVRRGRVLDRDLLQDPPRGVHRRFPQLLRVHLPEALVPLIHHAFVPELLREVLPLLLRVRVVGLLPLPYLVQRWLRDVHVACVNHWLHVPEEEREEEGRDVLAIHVSISHGHYLMVPDLLEYELRLYPRADRGDQRADFLVLQHLVELCLLHIQDLPLQRENRLELALPARLGTPPRARAFHDKNFRLRGIPLLAVREPPREVEPLEEPLAAGELPRLPRGLSRLCREDRLLEDRLRGLRGLVQELHELLVHAGVHDSLHLGVPQFHLRLPLELGLGNLDREDRREALAAVVAVEALPALHVLVSFRVVVQRPGERRLEADQVCAALFLFFQAEDGIRDDPGDWSSDVCSSDLNHIARVRALTAPNYSLSIDIWRRVRRRSEERRVGKECRSRWSPYH